MRTLIAGLAVTVALAVPAYAATKSADAKFTAITDAEWKWRVAQFGNQDGKTIDDHLQKVDAASQEMYQHHWEDVLKQVQAIPRAQLSDKQQINYDVYIPQIQTLIADQKFRTFEMPANSDSQFWSGFGEFDEGALKT